MNNIHLIDRRRRASQSRGFTLVEMMVAMVIGIFLSMALAGIYVALKRSFLGEDSLTSTQENQRLALNTITNSIQSAGYFPDALNSTLVSTFPADATFKTAGQVIYGAVTNNKASVSVRYQVGKDEKISNCAGAENTTGADAIFANTFSVNGNNELVCDASINGGTATKVVLARNISKIDFQYAIDKDSDGILDSYLDTSNAAGFGWINVHAIRVDLTFIDTISKPESAAQAMPKTITQYINMMNTYEVTN